MHPKTILVTGGSSGIGQAICEHLSQQGHQVIGTSRSPKSQPNGYPLIGMDVTDADSVRAGVAEAHKLMGSINVLINNAGLGIAGSLEETPISEVQRVLDTNVMGLLRVCQATLPIMRQQGQGLIINMSSVGGQIGLPFRGIYSASKFAVEGLTESLSMECQPFGIQVCSVLPGSFNTAINQNRIINESPEGSPYRQAFERTLELVRQEVGQAGDPKEVAQAVANIIQSPQPKLRYIVANGKQKLSTLVKKLIPGRAFERMVMKHYS